MPSLSPGGLALERPFAGSTEPAARRGAVRQARCQRPADGRPVRSFLRRQMPASGRRAPRSPRFAGSAFKPPFRASRLPARADEGNRACRRLLGSLELLHRLNQRALSAECHARRPPPSVATDREKDTVRSRASRSCAPPAERLCVIRLGEMRSASAREPRSASSHSRSEAAPGGPRPKRQTVRGPPRAKGQHRCLDAGRGEACGAAPRGGKAAPRGSHAAVGGGVGARRPASLARALSGLARAPAWRRMRITRETSDCVL